MNKKYTFGIIFILFIHYTYAQVGINTETPQATLDIKGNLQVRKDIKLGGTEGNTGSPGISNSSLLTSQGPGKSPLWMAAGTTPTSFAITQSIVNQDEVGIIFTQNFPYSNLIEFPENMDITSAGWVEIPGLKAEISPSRTDNKVVMSLQTVLQSPSSRNVDADAAIGIFIDGKLKAVRSAHIAGTLKTFTVLNLMDAVNNLPPKTGGATYSIQVAGILRYLDFLPESNTSSPLPESIPPHNQILLGTSNTDANNTTGIMNQTSLKIDVYEDMTENIIN